MTEYHYTYIVILPTTGEFYIGVRSSKCLPEDDTYKGSMKTWKVDKTKLVKGIFNVFSTREEANEDEERLIKKYINEPLNRNYHNTKNFCNKGLKCSEETKLKLSIAKKGKKGKPRSEETKLKISIAKKGKPHSEDSKIKMSIAKKGKKIKPHSEEHKLKMSIAKKGKKGKPHSEETKLKISIARKGKKNVDLIKNQNSVKSFYFQSSTSI